MTDGQPQTAWLDTLHSGEATKTEMELREVEESGGERADERSFRSERSQGEKIESHARSRSHREILNTREKEIDE